MLSAHQLVAATRESPKPRYDDPAAAEALLTAIGHLATPTTKRARYFLNRGVNEQIKAKRDPQIEPSEAPGLFGAEPPVGIEDDLAMLRGDNPWFEIVIPEDIYKVGIGPLKQPDTRNPARIWNWLVNSHHREQMRTKWPQPVFQDRYRRLYPTTPRAFPTDPGGQCCRWIARCWLKSCPLECWRRAK